MMIIEKGLITTLRKVSDNELEPLDREFLPTMGIKEGDIVKLQFQNASTSGTVTPNMTIAIKKDLSDVFPVATPDNISVNISKLRDKPENIWMEVKQYLGEK